MTITLNIDLNLLLQSEAWPIELISAILEFNDDISSDRLSPITAKKLIKKHIDPLMPTDSISPSSRLGCNYPKWDDFVIVGRVLEQTRQTRLEQFIGTFFIHLPSWVQKIDQQKKKLYIYCQFCWRHTIQDQKFCIEHSSQINPTKYRQAQRLKNDFEACISELRRKDSLNGCNTDWHNVLAEQSEFESWLKKYRTLTAQLLDKYNLPHTLDHILLHLDRPNDETKGSSLSDTRARLHSLIESDLDQSFGMLRRLEAYLMAKKNRPHGGQRDGSGRKEKQ